MEFYCYNKTIAESTTGEGGFMKKEDESQGRWIMETTVLHCITVIVKNKICEI